MDVARGTIAIWSDIGCPWAHLAVHRLHETRRRLELVDAVTFEHRPFPLELFNERVTPKKILAAEVRALRARAADVGWQEWAVPEWEWPVTTLPALEAVQAVSAHDVRAAEELDRALRFAFFGESRCISMRHVILEVAAKCDRVDLDALAGTLDDGVARRTVMARFDEADRGHDVAGSPHLFLADGTGAHNPGIEMHWERAPGGRFPVIDRDDPAIYEELLRRAAG